MGRDKFENEELIKWGLPTDIWFHVDGYSSAHVYLRLPSTDINIDTIPKEILEECLQIVKDNSIEGCKFKSVKVCYTPWANLLKSKDMEVGAIGHKNKQDMRYTHVEKNKDIIKALNKTKIEKEVDLEMENVSYYKSEQNKKKKVYLDNKKKQEEEETNKKALLSEKKFEYLEEMAPAKTNKKYDDDDFM